MKNKKLLTFILSLLLLFVFCACDIGQYVGPDSSGGNSGSATSSGSDSSGGDPVEDPNVFSVVLYEIKTVETGKDENGKPVYEVQRNLFPKSALGTVQAKWTDKESQNSAYYTASFDAQSRAQISGLDGDYKVTLTALPDGYTYNPNIYEANNDNRVVSIDLYKLTPTSGKGTGWYGGAAINVSSMGAYRATLTRSNYRDGVHFCYTPTTSGVYSIESIIDTTEDKLNPFIDIYFGNVGWVPDNPSETRDDGGTENTYTKNFRWEIDLAENERGNVFWFSIRATTLAADVFPINVDFILDKDGEFTSGRVPPSEKMTPTEDFEKATWEREGNTWHAMYQEDADGDGKADNLLNGDLVKFWSTDEGGDGYYHLYDKETGTYGNLLFACIGQSNSILGDSILGEYVTVSYLEGYNYNEFFYQLDESGSYILTDPNGVKLKKNYGNYPTYPVNEELQLFLQRFSVSKRLFNDGNGVGEALADSTEEDQWLFACGYYT